jgi:hypothetical protein
MNELTPSTITPYKTHGNVPLRAPTPRLHEKLGIKLCRQAGKNNEIPKDEHTSSIIGCTQPLGLTLVRCLSKKSPKLKVLFPVGGRRDHRELAFHISSITIRRRPLGMIRDPLYLRNDWLLCRNISWRIAAGNTEHFVSYSLVDFWSGCTKLILLP